MTPRRAEEEEDDGVELLQGTLTMMILKALSWGPMHGYAILSWLQQVSEDALRVEEGSLYPALYRLEDRDWIAAEWALTENGRRAKYYRLTAAGRRQLAAQAKSYQEFTAAMARILNAKYQPA